MKINIFLKKIYKVAVWAFFALYFIPEGAFSQNTLYEHPGYNSEFSLIRHYRDSIDIRFEPWTNQNFCVFIYVDRATQTTLLAEASYLYDIQDFEIYDGNVYFCGDRNGNAHFGYFNIDSVFFLNGDIHYVELTSDCPLQEWHTGLDHIRNMMKLEVVKVDDLVHIYMLGISDCIGYYSKEIVAEAWQDPANGWRFQYALNREEIVSYSDIAITDNYVVVLGHEPRDNDNPVFGNTEQWILHYDRPTTSMGNLSAFEVMSGGILPSPPFVTTPVHITPSSIYSTHGIWENIEAMKNDEFAIECTDNTLGIFQCVVSLFPSPTQAPYARFTIPTERSMEEISWNPVADALCMVNGWDYLIHIDVPSLTIEKKKTDPFIWFSIDRIPDKEQFTLAGVEWDLSMEKYWLYSIGYNNCLESEELTRVDLEVAQTHNSIPQIIIECDINWNDHPVDPIESEIMIICE